MIGTLGVFETLGSTARVGERIADVVLDAAAHGTVVDHRTVGVCAARRRVAGVRCWSQETVHLLGENIAGRSRYSIYEQRSEKDY